MRRVGLAGETDFAGWRKAARALALAGVPAEAVSWEVAGGAAGLFGGDEEALPAKAEAPAFTVPRAFMELAESAILHRDPERFALLYALLLRVLAEPGLVGVAVDPLVARIRAFEKAVRRDIHKTHAFVRFRRIGTEPGERFVAWFEPSHHTLEASAPFFVRRFAAMHWSILTPERSAHWDGETLRFGPGADRAAAPSDDALEELWRRYYAAIFNPARLKVAAMRAEMPKKYWRNLPEAPLILPLIADAQRRTGAMIAHAETEPKPNRMRAAKPRDAAQEAGLAETELAAVRRDAAGCEACPLYRNATQTVFGEGPETAEILFVGEQPGDKEDLAGRPFVGPAGQLFDRALAEAGIDRAKVYVTNAVKHFKFEPRGKIRLHMKPNGAEIAACRPWYEKEKALVRPKLVVAMGATAAQAVFGRAMPVGRNRGRVVPLDAEAQAYLTVHPSYLLRLPDADAKAREYERFVAELKEIADLLPAARRSAA
ncbi:UdgX family uracil-DNA binding protein [Prosthecomicrobium pneumaticum]|uniref:Type-4 uracil-DNA glycosylase n=1 Tax=Prosthecomicrobium pneumaticum TaxID=81895 RepID=A0A7W9FJS3_9HYPH|nr:UdgX family uracil-DNA binding protein [Prosthecomicrobium pneumaticum]MBB5751795.1 DNA polymerase [Prosthecomicrobium pneumaticum]